MAKKKLKIGEIDYERIFNWEGGMNDAVDASLLDGHESPLLENASLDQKGTLGVRRGRAERYSPDISNSPVVGVTAYYKSDGTAILLIATNDGSLYTDTPHLVNSFKVQSEFEQGTLQAMLSETEGKLLPMTFSTGFEEGSFSYFHTRDTGWKIDTEIHKTGSLSAKCTGEGQRLARELLFSASNVYIKHSVRFGEEDKIHYPVILISPSNTEIHAVVADADGKFKYHDGASLNEFPESKEYEKDTFYDVEVWVRGSKFWVSIDGTSITPSGVSMKDTEGTAHHAVTKALFKNSKDEEETTMWIDDLTINSLALVFTRPTVLGDVKANTPRYERILF